MGFSWSLHFAQHCVSQIVRGAPGLRDTMDLGDGVGLKRVSLGDTLQYTYVDNIGVLGDNPKRVSDLRKSATGALDAIGLTTHELSEAVSTDEALGICIDGKTRQATLSEKRFGRLRGALFWILQQQRVNGKQLEVLVGHLTFAFMLNRPLLSCLSATYRYIRANYTGKGRLWNSVIAELRACRQLLPLVCSRWDMDFSTMVTAYDACESGFGVVSATWSKQDVYDCARHSERQ
eukprot:2014011-Amphidinium_carterae.1